MPSGMTIGVLVTDVHTEAKLPLGFIYVEPAQSVGTRAGQGEREWVYVFNDEAATAFAEGDIIARDASTVTYDGILAPTSAPAARVLGVAQHAIAAGSYGFILRRGIGEVLADTGGITANTAIAVGNAVAGRADDAAATTDAIGFATEAAAATALATCFINCRG